MKDNQLHVNKSRLGGLKRVALYGNPGTLEGRSKGGFQTCKLFQSRPELARKRGFIIRKEIQKPPQDTELASFIGIMLGDGSICSRYQFTVSFNYKTDREYAEYVARLIKRLFAVRHTISRKRGCLGADIVVSSVGIVSFLLARGLTAGNKIKNQVDIPGWIKNNTNFQKACLRGLFDTDGSLYCHRYKVNGKWYEYLKLDFTSCSKPLLYSVYEILSNLGIKYALKGVHISISAQADVNKYLAKVGSSNSKFLYKWRRLDYRRSG